MSTNGENGIFKISNGIEIIQNQNTDTNQKLKIYKKRYWMLFLYSICAMLNNVQATKYTSVANIFSCFYKIPTSLVNWTAMIFMVLVILLAVPSAWFLNKFGLRKTMVTGSALNLICTIIQCSPINSNQFYMPMISQFIASITMSLLIPIPPKLANTWFGPQEICKATAIAVVGFQSGSAICFLVVPPFLSYNCSETENIRYGHSLISYILLGCNLIIFLLILISFKNMPNIPPNLAEAMKEKLNNFKEVFIELATSVNFVLLFITFGILIGILYTITVVLNEMLIPLYPKSEMEIGWIGVLMYVTGIIGSLITGPILDKTHKFKEVLVGITCFAFLSACIFTGLIEIRKIWIPMITIALCSFFLMSYITAGLEMASEITYPNPESIASGLLNASSMIFGIVFTIVGSYINETHGRFFTNLFLCAFLLLACVINGFIKCDYKRTKRNQGDKNRERNGII